MTNKVLKLFAVLFLFAWNVSISVVPSYGVETENASVNNRPTYKEPTKVVDVSNRSVLSSRGEDVVPEERKPDVMKDKEPQLYIDVPGYIQDAISDAAIKFNVPKDILFSIAKIESGFNPNETGSYGDIGLFQITPMTAYEINKIGFGIKGFYSSMLYNPDMNAEFAAWYLSYLHEKTGSWVCAITAYNRGLGGMNSYMKSHGNAYSSYYVKVNESHKELYGSMLNY